MSGEQIESSKNMKLMKPSKESKESQESTTSKECTIDDCVRWNLLLKSVNLDTGVDGEEGIQTELSKIILENRGYLAFEYPYKGVSEEMKVYRNSCTNLQHEGYKAQGTPFRVAAKSGNFLVIRAMISEGRKFYEKQSTEPSQLRQEFLSEGAYLPLPSIIQEMVPWKSDDDKTALMLAMQAEKNSEMTLEKLVEVPGIDPLKEDRTFEKAIQEGQLEVVEIFLSRAELAEAFATHKYILKALDTWALTTTPHADQDRRLEILRCLVSKATGHETFDHKIVQRIITGDLDGIWGAMRDGVVSKGVKPRLLHLAVYHQKQNFVRMFLEQYPESVKQEEAVTEEGSEKPSEKHYPLWYNNNPYATAKPSGSEADGVKKQIRNDIVNKMIHEVYEVETLTNIFFKSNGMSITRYSSPHFGISWTRAAN